MVKFPSKSEVVPLLVPLIITFAPGRGLLELASVIVPVIVPCPNPKNGVRNVITIRNLIKLSCLRF
jgi:hypothetical protein